MHQILLISRIILISRTISRLGFFGGYYLLDVWGSDSKMHAQTVKGHFPPKEKQYVFKTKEVFSIAFVELFKGSLRDKYARVNSYFCIISCIDCIAFFPLKRGK